MQRWPEWNRSRRARWSRARHGPLLVVVTALLLLPGCVQRRLTIRTNPPGALVYVDNYEIGTTPVTTNFTYYGQREIRLVRDGFETQTFLQPIPPPWYQIFPLDFIAENVIPWELRDERIIDRPMTPQMVVPAEELLSRAQNLRGTSRAAAATVPGTMAPTIPGASVAPPSGMFPQALPPVVVGPPPGPAGAGGRVGPAPPPQQMLPAQR